MIAFSKLPLVTILSPDIALSQRLITLMWKGLGLFFPFSDFSIRAIPAFFGALLVPATYLFSRHLLSPSGSLVAALLVMISPIEVVYSQHSSNYAIWSFLVVAYLHFFLNYRKWGRQRDLWGFLALAWLANAFHVYNLFFLIGIGMFQLTSWKGREKENRNVLGGLVLVGVLSSWFFYDAWRISKVQEAFQGEELLKISLGRLAGLIRLSIMAIFSGNTGTGYTPHWASGSSILDRGLTLVICLLFVMTCILNLLRRTKGSNLLMLLIAVTWGLEIYGSSKSGFYAERYFLPTIALFFILWVRGLSFLGSNPKTFKFSFFIQAVLLIHFGLLTANSYSRSMWHQDWRSMMETVRNRVKGAPREDFAILVPINVESPLVAFYLPEWEDRILTDSPYHSYLLDPKMINVFPVDAARFNVDLALQAKASSVKTLYIATQRGGEFMSLLTDQLSDQFRLEKIPHGDFLQLHVFHRKNQGLGIPEGKG